MHTARICDHGAENKVYSWYLVDGKANGVQVGSQLAFFPSIFLHQCNKEAADNLFILRIIIFLQELQAVLGIGPKCICEIPPTAQSKHVKFQLSNNTHDQRGLLSSLPVAPEGKVKTGLIHIFFLMRYGFYIVVTKLHSKGDKMKN